jgi:primase-polymerase (primpol)-like protein
LWEGSNDARSGDWSRADLALVDHPAWWSQGDVAQIDRLFRQSGRMRPKWDEPHSGDGRTYGEIIVDKAMKGRTDFYNPNGEAAGEGEPAEKVVEAAADPHRLARLYLGEHTAEGVRCLRW